MSYSVFGVDSGNNGAIFKRLKPYPTPNILTTLPANAIPVVRSGNSNYFLPNATTSTSDTNHMTVVSLYASYPVALILSTDFTLIAAGAKILAMFLSSADQCMYVLFKGSDLVVRLSKISDTTGAVTNIGSFTPVTAVNWSLNIGTATLEIVGGDLRYVNNGFSHTINKTTGAIITQDVPFGLSGYTTINANYLSVDSTIYSYGELTALPPSDVNSCEGSLTTPSVSHASIGIVRSQTVNIVDVLGVTVKGFGVSQSSIVRLPYVLIDNDKMCFTQYLSNQGCPLSVVTRASFDDFLLSIVNWHGGV